jgi:hypothetical protein
MPIPPPPDNILGPADGAAARHRDLTRWLPNQVCQSLQFLFAATHMPLATATHSSESWRAVSNLPTTSHSHTMITTVKKAIQHLSSIIRHAQAPTHLVYQKPWTFISQAAVSSLAVSVDEVSETGPNDLSMTLHLSGILASLRITNAFTMVPSPPAPSTSHFSLLDRPPSHTHPEA